MKTRILMGLCALAVSALLAAPAVTADNDKRPPKQALDQMKSMLVDPDTSPNGGGAVDPKKGTQPALILRDPETGLVLRDANGLPQVLLDDKGKPKSVPANEVPEEQRNAQRKADERAERAGNGDVNAQRELREDVEKTRNAIKAVRGKLPADLPPVPPVGVTVQ